MKWLTSKYLLSTIIMLLLTINTYGVGGIWVLEIQCDINEKKTISFIKCDYWAHAFDRFIGEDSLFGLEFQRLYGGLDSISVYSEIIDREKLAKAAAFPMHPFQLKQESAKTYRVDQISNVSLIKVWVRNAYTINVLTQISESDTSWISGTATKTYPTDEGVGCRLEVYNFGNKQSDNTLMQKMLDIYLNEDKLNVKLIEQQNRILMKLKKRRIVVVELCGC